VLLSVAVLAAVSCRSQPPLVPNEPPAAEPVATRRLPAGSFLLVSKAQRTLSVYQDGQAVSTYDVVFGLRPQGPKRFEGDMRTPEGFYHVVEARPHPRWRYFISLDYPNQQDREAYGRDRRAGLIPAIDHRVLSIGGAIGIHGSDHPKEQRSGVDWTKGCIAMNNRDIARLARIVEPGMPVLIEP